MLMLVMLLRAVRNHRLANLQYAVNCRKFFNNVSDKTSEITYRYP